MLNTAIPYPSQWVSNQTIEEIATECNKLYRQVFNVPNGCSVDVEEFIDTHFQISMMRDYLNEPEDTILFAEFSNDEYERITVNEKYKSLFDSRPEILRSVLGHELAHYVLRHYELLHKDNETLSLFPDQEITENKLRNLHRRSWQQHGLTTDDITKLVKLAVHSDTARQFIAKLYDKLEPEWMFWQAEHFSMCLLIPKDKLFEITKENTNFEGWHRIYELARHFGVSPSMMRVRLKKLRLIEINPDGKPSSSTSKQVSLFKL